MYWLLILPGQCALGTAWEHSASQCWARETATYVNCKSRQKAGGYSCGAARNSGNFLVGQSVMLRRSAFRGRQGEMSMLSTSCGRSSLVQATGVAILSTLALAASGASQLAHGQVFPA